MTQRLLFACCLLILSACGISEDFQTEILPTLASQTLNNQASDVDQDDPAENPIFPTLTPVPDDRSADFPSGIILPPDLPVQIRDVNAVMDGICFESAFDAAGRVFVMRTAEEHIRFYDLSDHSKLCRRPVKRLPFDFTQGSILAGFWSTGTGCKARHDILDVTRDDASHRITIRTEFLTDGDCPYELVRPFWLAIDGVPGYEIVIETR